MLSTISASGQGSFLAVLKNFGRELPFSRSSFQVTVGGAFAVRISSAASHDAKSAGLLPS
jgi:hypothetical protein